MVGPTPIANTTAAGGSWQNVLQSITQFGVDYARQKLLDVERVSDDNNVPDQADLRYGSLGQPGIAGMTLGGTLLLVGVVLGAGVLLYKLVK